MLDVIGAGATATSEIDWHAAWNKSEEATNFKIRLNEIHEEGRKKPPVQATQHSEFATSWTSQLWELTVRANIAYWRNPTYIMSKELLNVAGGLFIGFTFFNSDNTLQGTQNKLFVRFFLRLFVDWLAQSPLCPPGRVYVDDFGGGTRQPVTDPFH